MPLPRPIRPLRCDHEDCTFPDGGTCALAATLADPIRECPELLREDEPREEEAGADVRGADWDEEVADVRLGDLWQPARDAAPWAGRHLDRSTADELLRTSPARLVAVVGPHDAGKTSLLASFFLQLANGQCRALPYRFASSRTFHALHEIADQIQSWDRAQAAAGSSKPATGGQIVGHTPRQEGPDRFLHLGLCPRDPDDRRHIHVLLSDVAGEWFSDYTARADATMRVQIHVFFCGDILKFEPTSQPDPGFDWGRRHSGGALEVIRLAGRDAGAPGVVALSVRVWGRV